MPRIRSIKPEFWQDEDLAELDAESRLLAIGLLNHSDDEGYFKANHSLVRAAVFPFSDSSLNIHGMLQELSEIGYLSLFDGSDGKQYGKITNFSSHQVINRPTASKIKELETSMKTHGEIREDSHPERKGKERNREQGKEQGAASGDADVSVPRELRTEWFETLWSTWDTEFGQKGAKTEAKKYFLEKLKPDESLFNEILSSLRAHIEIKSELKDRGEFYESFPHVIRWLRNERWTDELPSATSERRIIPINPADEALYRKYPHLRPQ